MLFIKYNKIKKVYFWFSAIIVVLIFLCCFATIHQYTKISFQQDTPKNHNYTHSVFYSFSFIKSGKDLIKYDENNELNLYNGFKFLIMLFVVFGHRFLYVIGNPIDNVKIIENMYVSGPDILLTSMNLVDSFLYISGLLLFITLTPVFKKSGSIGMKIVLEIIYKVLNILPSYILIILITINIVLHLGDGPLWSKSIRNEAELCKNYWWTNVLFINNYFDAKYQCHLASWYLSCHVQLVIIGIIIIGVNTKSSKYGKCLIGVLISLCLLFPFIITYVMKSDGILKLYLPFLKNPRDFTAFNKSYRETYMRAIPFLVGMALGPITKSLKEKKFKMSQITVYGGTILVTLLCLYIQFIGVEFYKIDTPHYPIEHALYATLCHCTWTAIGVWVTICHHTTGYGLLSKILSNRFCVILGRLSFNVYLVNFTVIQISQNSLRSPTYLSVKTLLELWIYDIFICYLLGFILHMIVDEPFRNLTKYLFGRRKKNTSSNRNESPNEQVLSIDISTRESSKF